ncbi:unnamed protein product [Parnassius apollo]|uniref:(apollo) hypothetical protein n=1 Tax=Parnassius apollo TaxID=110799 RepID=A0A8S3YCH5_PARAO|nr:unnamed protein product [Parnassius apollo]
MCESVSQKSIPITTTSQAIFDNDFLALKQRFISEMQRMDQEITRFSTNLMNLYEYAPSERCSLMDSTSMSVKTDPASQWEVITNSPLVEGEDENKTLKLQFDLSQFEPTEVKVSIMNDILLVQASHEERTPDCTIFREYAREVQLPKGLDPDVIASFLSRDGVLTVQAPLQIPVKVLEDRASIKNKYNNNSQSSLA